MNISINTSTEARHSCEAPKLSPAQKAFAVNEELAVHIEEICKHLNLSAERFFADQMSGSENYSIRTALAARLNLTTDAELGQLYIDLDAIRCL